MERKNVQERDSFLHVMRGENGQTSVSPMSFPARM